MRRSAKLVNEKVADQLQTAAEGFERVMELALPGRLEEVPEDLGYALMALRDAAREVISALGSTRDKSVQDEDAVRKQALRHAGDGARRGRAHHATAPSGTSSGTSATTASAPRCGWPRCSVSGLLREKLFADRSVVLTSATLKLGGDFNGVGASLGLSPEGTGRRGRRRSGRASTSARRSTIPSRASCTSPSTWPPPGREGSRGDMLDELAELMEAAGGRTLGLFSSMRAAQAAAEELRGRLEHPILLQGEETLGELIKAFAADPKTCLFGTLSLWQGVDVPGPELPAGGDGPDPVPASRRPADERPRRRRWRRAAATASWRSRPRMPRC